MSFLIYTSSGKVYFMAPDRALKNGPIKPKCVPDRETTGNIAFNTLLAKCN